MFKHLHIIFLRLACAFCFCLVLGGCVIANNIKVPDLPVVDWSDLTIFKSGLTDAQVTSIDSLSHLSVYNLALAISDDMRQIRGVEEIHYTNNEDVSLDNIWLGLFPELLGGEIRIGLVSVNGQQVNVEHVNGMLRIPLTLAKGDSAILHIEFEETVPSNGSSYYYGIFGYNEKILSLAHACPTVMANNDGDWNNKTPDISGDVLDSDASFYLVTIDAPVNQVIVASGTMVEQSQTGNRQIVRFASGPARDFYLAASSDFEVLSETDGGVTINSYYLKNASQSVAKSALNAARESISFFSSLFGPYPYTEFDIVPIGTIASGVEYPGLTAVDMGYYSSNDSIEGTIVHEVSHQWFYNQVGNDPQTEPYLDESLTQYNTCLFYLSRDGTNAGENCMNKMQSRWDNASDASLTIGLPVDMYTGADYSAIIYGKGAFFFKALQERMSQPSYEAFVRDYIRSYTWQIGSTDELKAMAEAHCNCDLTDMFNTWVNP